MVNYPSSPGEARGALEWTTSPEEGPNHALEGVERILGDDHNDNTVADRLVGGSPLGGK